MTRYSFIIDNPLSNESPKAENPVGTKIRLYDHQLASLAAMHKSEMCQEISHPSSLHLSLTTSVGVLGDKPGAGKSYVMLALSLSKPPVARSEVQDISISPLYGYTSLHRRDGDTRTLNTNVIVIPHGIADQWASYMTEYLPDEVKRIVICRTKHLNQLTQEAMFANEYKIIVITISMLPVLSSRLELMKCKVWRVFFDECDSINVKTANHIMADFYWFVTASFHNLLTPRGGFVTLYDGTRINAYGYDTAYLRLFFDPLQRVAPELLKQIVIFGKDEFIDESLNLPTPVFHKILCKTPYSVRMLEGHVRDTVIHALNAGDVGLAVKTIGAVADTEANIVDAVINKYIQKQNDLEARLRYLNEFGTSPVFDYEKSSLEAKIVDITRNLNTIRERIKASVTCPICFEEYKNKTVVPCCQNAFCMLCITQWARSSSGDLACPMCKASLILEQCMICNETEVHHEAEIYTMDGIGFIKYGEKIENLKRLLVGTNEERKFLIFSEYDYHLENDVANMLFSEGIKFRNLKHNAATIRKTVSEFASGNIRVLLINSAHYGCGMNLPQATDVVILHKLKEGKSYQQVVGRAQRGKRCSSLNVWYFLNESENDTS